MKTAKVVGLTRMIPVAGVLLVGACGTQPNSNVPEQATQPVTGGAVPMAVPNDWLGYKVGVAPPTLHSVGVATNFATGVGVGPREGREDHARSNDGSEVQTSQLMAMGPDHRLYEVGIADQDREKLSQYFLAHNLNGEQQSHGAPARGAEGVVQWRRQSFALGVRVSVVPPATRWARSRPTTASARGTLFWNRLVLTAFHCLWDDTATGSRRTPSPPAATRATNHTMGRRELEVLGSGVHRQQLPQVEGHGLSSGL